MSRRNTRTKPVTSEPTADVAATEDTAPDTCAPTVADAPAELSVVEDTVSATESSSTIEIGERAAAWTVKAMLSYLGAAFTDEVRTSLFCALGAGLQPCIVREGRLFALRVYELPFEPYVPDKDAPSTEVIFNVARRMTGAGLYPKR